MQTAMAANQMIEEWGDGLALRISAPIAKAARFAHGLSVRVEVAEGGVFVRATRKAKPKLTLAQKLKAFDPAVHGGE